MLKDTTTCYISTEFETGEIAVHLHGLGGGLQVTANRRSAFSIANKCQGQMRTPQSVRVVCSLKYSDILDSSCECARMEWLVQ